jgi:hypothetical protein
MKTAVFCEKICVVLVLTLKMETEFSSESFVNVYRTIKRLISMNVKVYSEIIQVFSVRSS